MARICVTTNNGEVVEIFADEGTIEEPIGDVGKTAALMHLANQIAAAVRTARQIEQTGEEEE